MPAPKVDAAGVIRSTSVKKPKRVNTNVLGGTGLPSYGFIHDDFIPGLNGLAGIRKYREMQDNDPVIFAMLYAITMLLRGVTWRVEPATGDGVDENLAQLAVEFVQQCFFEDMQYPFEDFISEVVSFLGYGHDVHEIVLKVRDGKKDDPVQSSRFTDQRIGIAKLAPRSQETIFRWDMDSDGTVSGLWQTLPDRPMVYIPANKFLLFRTTTNKGNPEGRSVLRGAYVPYERKQYIEQAEGRAAMRSAGLVVMRIPAEYLSPEASPDQQAVATAYKRVADTVSQDRQGSIVLPSDVDERGHPFFDIGYVSTEGRRPIDMSPVVERYDKRIAMSVLADFIMLGQQSVGSFALSSDKTQLFNRSLAAHLNMIQAPLNRKLLPMLWELNGFDEALMPKLVPGDVSGRSLQELGAYVQQLSAAGARLFPDMALENDLRDAAGLPELTEDTLEEMDEAKDEEQQRQQDNFAAQAQARAGQYDGGSGSDDDNED